MYASLQKSIGICSKIAISQALKPLISRDRQLASDDRRRGLILSCKKAGPKRGAFLFFWSEGCGAASPPIEEVGPSVVFDAAFDGEQGVGACFRPAAP